MAERSIIDHRVLKERLFPNGASGVTDENDTLRTALLWGPVSTETYLASLHPEDVSLFYDDMDVIGARAEFHGFHQALSEQGVELAIGRDILADVEQEPTVPSIDALADLLLAKAREIEEAHDKYSGKDHEAIIRALLDRDVKRYGEPTAIALNEQLALFASLPLGNIMFACDQMKFIGEKRVRSRFAFPIRKPEAQLFQQIYDQLGMNECIKVPDGETFEGGDLYIHNGVVYIGVGARTSMGAVKHIFTEARGELDKNGLSMAAVVDQKLTGKSRRESMDYMHLDTWSAPLDKRTVMVYPEEANGRMVALLSEDRDGAVRVSETGLSYTDFLRRRGSDVIEHDVEEEQRGFAFNNLCIDDKTVLVANGANHGLLETLERLGKNVVILDLAESTKGYGAAHCMTAQLLRT